ncbi:MAG: glycosyltransferase, partial [Anaerolineaceae bacterium]|nr:glycosyltransferase [Anaerolineaceae bacterium]
MISIIIPAHNESSVIARCCEALLNGALPRELEIIVVCNGCTDNTAEVARSISKDIKVVETGVPSKSNALNIGDSLATSFPRFYIDADVIVPLDSVRKTAVLLQNQNILAAAPSMEVDLAGRGFFVKAFYRVWLALPYC